MQRFVRYTIFYCLLIGIVVNVVISLGSRNAVNAVITDGGARPQSKTLTESLEGWQYNYTIAPQDQGVYWAAYNYSLTSQSEVETAVKAMRQSAINLAQTGATFKVTLVFAKPMSVADFKVFSQQTEIKPSISYIQAISSNGELAEASIPAKTGSTYEPLDDNRLDTLQTRQHNPLKILGIVSTEVTLDTRTLAKVSADNRVYAFDTTAEKMLSNVQKEFPAAKVENIQVGRSLLYNAMQATGIAPLK